MDRDAAYGNRWKILGILCLSLVLIGLDTFVLNLALPRIQSSLDASTGGLQWIIDAYALTFGGLLLLAGGMADRFGRRRLLTIGLVVFGGISLGASFAGTSAELIACRAGMGVGAALMMPATLAIIKDVFPVDEQAKAIGIWSGAAAIGVPLGPVVSGLLVQHFWWGSVFLINVPLSLLALIGIIVMVPESRDISHPGIDIVGALLSVIGLVLLVYGLIEAPQDGWGSPVTVVSLVVGVIALACFIWWERHARSPMLAVDLLAQSRYGGSFLAILCVSFGLYSMLFLLTQYLQSVTGLGPLAAGTRMLAVATMMIGAPISHKLVERAGLKVTVIAGLLLCAAGLGVMAALSVSSEALAVIGLGVYGFGAALVLPAVVDGILAASADRQAGAGSAIADVGMQVGGSLGIAVTGSIAVTLYHGDLPRGLPVVVRSSVGAAVMAGQRVGGSAGLRLADVARDAFVDAFTGAIWIAIAVSVLGAIAASVILPRARVAAVQQEEQSEASQVTGRE